MAAATGLTYQGDGRFVPGWPASDHNEPDEDLRAAKVASGLYTACATIPPVPEPVAAEPEPSPAPQPRPANWWAATLPPTTDPAADAAQEG